MPRLLAQPGRDSFTAGTKDVANVDRRIASVLGTPRAN
jgi:hypothetical protein